MKVKGLTLKQLTSVVNSVVNVTFEYPPIKQGNYYRFKLRCQMSQGPFHRLGQSITSKGNRRKLVALCWHGYREVMQRIYKVNPDTIISTAQITYHDKRDFDRNYHETGYKNIGSMIEPFNYIDACECE